MLHVPETLHKYAYAKNNPISYVDLEGLYFLQFEWSTGSYNGYVIDPMTGFLVPDPGGSKEGGKKGPKTTKLTPPDDSETLKKEGEKGEEGEKEIGGKEHTKGKRPSTTEKHQKGQRREKMGQGGDKKRQHPEWQDRSNKNRK